MMALSSPGASRPAARQTRQTAGHLHVFHFPAATKTGAAGAASAGAPVSIHSLGTGAALTADAGLATSGGGSVGPFGPTVGGSGSGPFGPMSTGTTAGAGADGIGTAAIGAGAAPSTSAITYCGPFGPFTSRIICCPAMPGFADPVGMAGMAWNGITT